MAYVSKPRGVNKDCYLIQFYDEHGKKRGISISKASYANAIEVKEVVEGILKSRQYRQPIPAEICDWISTASPYMQDKFIKAGLSGSWMSPAVGKFLEKHFIKQRHWQASTRVRHEVTRDHFLACFDESKLVRSFTVADAMEWISYLKGHESLKSNSSRSKHLSNVRSYFKAAVHSKIIATNPFSQVSIPKQPKGEIRFITQLETQRILNSCPDHQWKLIFALARYGGLRMTSEINRLKWSDVDWDKGKILIHSPQTSNYPGRESRLIPIFPELFCHLQESQSKSLNPDGYVVTASRDKDVLSSAYIRGRMRNIIKQAGINPWPKLFINCRRTRMTELVGQGKPEHLVGEWMGATQLVMRNHGLWVRESDFTKN